MGKKNKKDKKGQGKEKTQLKTEKNAKKKAKKELAEIGEDDIEKMIAEFQEQDKRKTQVIEEKTGPPSPRCNMSLTAHPDKEELIMFGGEYFTGTKMFLYNDLLFYNIKKNEWLKVTAPNGPPPRSAHQAVGLKQSGGQLWIFGGEFASPTQSQFYHYKDLWVYHLKDKQWEKINAPGGPSSRSGHRMVQCKRLLIVFGGFHDNLRDCRYYNDVYTFNLENYTWTQVNVSGVPPAPRSACVMAPLQEQGKVLIYGGYSKEKVKKDIEVRKMHVDMFMLMPEGKVKEESQPSKWKWVTVKHSGAKPTPRSGLSMTVTTGNRAICFGGVFDEEEDEEEIKGRFFNNMYTLELDKGKWFDVELRGKKSGMEKKKRRRKKDKSDKDEDGDDDSDDGNELSDDDDDDIMDEGVNNIEKLTIENGANAMDTNDISENSPEASNTENQEGMETSEDAVFKITVGPQSSSNVTDNSEGASDNVEPSEVFMPSPRMNALMVVKNNQLFLYGGIYEDGDKQYTMSDFYSLDLHKLDEWNVIIQNDLKTQVWEESDSSSDDDDGDGDDGKGTKKKAEACGGESDSDDDDDDMDVDFTDAPDKESAESPKDYFTRTEEYWFKKAKEYCDSEDMELSDKQTRKLAKEMCFGAIEDN